MNDNRYYCKKNYYNNFTKGCYYDIWIDHNKDSSYLINWINNNVYNVNTIYVIYGSEMDKNFNSYFILATIHDRKIKLKILNED